MLKRWSRSHIAGWSSRVVQQPDSEFVISAIDWRGEVITRAKMGVRDLDEAKQRADELLRLHHPHTCAAQCSGWLRPGERSETIPEAEMVPGAITWLPARTWDRP